MRRNQSGFTLIELVMVIVILGILAAVALPKFLDIKTDASKAALNGVAGALSSASAVNYSVRLASNNTKGVALTNCNQAGTTLQGGALPTSGGTYTITALAVAVGVTVTCSIDFTPTGGAAVGAVLFTAIGA